MWRGSRSPSKSDLLVGLSGNEGRETGNGAECPAIEVDPTPLVVEARSVVAAACPLRSHPVSDSVVQRSAAPVCTTSPPLHHRYARHVFPARFGDHDVMRWRHESLIYKVAVGDSNEQLQNQSDAFRRISYRFCIWNTKARMFRTAILLRLLRVAEHFYRASAQFAMQSPVLVIVIMSVCLSVCLSHAGTVSKWRKIGPRNLHHR